MGKRANKFVQGPPPKENIFCRSSALSDGQTWVTHRDAYASKNYEDKDKDNDNDNDFSENTPKE